MINDRLTGANDDESEAKSASDHVREAFDKAKSALDNDSDDPHADAMKVIGAFLGHLAQSAEAGVRDAAAHLNNLFEEVA